MEGLAQYIDTIEFIKKAHEGQYRRNVLIPYYVHPIRVAALVQKYKHSRKIDELIHAALLHDVVEDTKISLKEIEEKYGTLVTSLVKELTNDDIEIKILGKTTYMKKKLLALSSWGLVIKLCDRLDNISDFLFAPITFRKRYGDETREIISHLKKNRQLSDTQKEIVSEIDEILNFYNIEDKEII